MAFASMFFASCMGDGYADPDNTIKVPAAPVGDRFGVFAHTCP